MKKDENGNWVAPDVTSHVDESYKVAQEELERQEKQNRLQQGAAILGDMARVFADAHGAKYGYRVDRRDSTLTDKALKHKEALMQGKAAMKQQYAKDRAAARREQLGVDISIENMNRAAEQARQAQANADRAFKAQEKAREEERNYRKARNAIEDDLREKEFKLRRAAVYNNFNKGTTSTGGSKGKSSIILSDGEGKQYAVSNDLWNGAMPVVYDAIKADIENDPRVTSGMRTKIRMMSDAEKGFFVKENWYKYPSAAKLIRGFVGSDDVTEQVIRNEVNDEDSQYKQESEEDYSQYKVK